MCVLCVSGKSSLLSALGNREVPIPDHIDIYHLQREIAPSDKTAVQCVMDVDAERVRLEHEAEQLSTMASDGTSSVSSVHIAALTRECWASEVYDESVNGSFIYACQLSLLTSVTSV